MNTSGERAVPEEDIEQVLAQILRLVDVTRDIERNIDDARFDAAGGRMHYVFDENVFEMFVNPKRWKSRTATFHSPFWLRRAGEPPSRNWSSIAAQSALIASEFLFSGTLPGQRTSDIYMTEWHSWELRDRVGDLTDELSLRARAMPPRRGHMFGNLDEQPFLTEDLQRLRDHGRGWTADAINRFVITRTAAQALASETVLEPLEQLYRIVSPPLRDRLSNLTDRFPVPPPEFEILARSSEVWMKRLEAEDRRHQNHHRRRGSMANDARSLALIEWAARKCEGTNDRVVMVTGDVVVFDAYRRWYSTLATDSSDYFRPFALRRLVQYAPIFNMNDGLGDITNARELFELTREAVEATLLPFNLSLMRAAGDAARVEAINRGREYFALKLVDAHRLMDDPAIRYFGQKLSDGWLTDSRAQLDALTLLWQRTERAAIGSMFDSVVPRLNDKQFELASGTAEPGAEELRPALTDYVNTLLDKIVEDSIRLWVPLASEFIDKGMLELLQDDITRSRPPILIRLEGEGDIPDDLAEILSRLRAGTPLVKSIFESQTGKLADQPEILFAIASVLALTRGAWSNAERFADLGMRAALMKSRLPRRNQNGPYEFAYLHSLARRFRIGELAPAQSEGAQRAIVAHYKDALGMLDECLRHHHARVSPLNRQRLRELRALSERAALTLFYGGACALVTHRGLRARFVASREVATTFAKAEDDLAQCLALERELPESATATPERAAFLTRLRRQYISNAAACAVACQIFLEDGRLPAYVTPAFCQGVARFFTEEGPSLPPIVRLELKAFLHLVGLEQLPSVAAVRELVTSEEYGGTLFLDSALSQAIQNWLENDIRTIRN